MTTITRTYHWPMGHRLQHHDGRCRFLHGHSYEAEVTVVQRGRQLHAAGPMAGMVLDFSALDTYVMHVLHGWDHAFMVQDGDPLLRVLLAHGDCVRLVVLRDPPTAEHIAAELARRLNEALDQQGVHVLRVAVHEGPKSVATVEVPL